MEPEPEQGAAVGNLTVHGQLLHCAALSAGAVWGQSVALDAATSAHAAAQHVVGVQVVSTLRSTGVSGKEVLAIPRSHFKSSISLQVFQGLPNPECPLMSSGVF